MSIISDTSGDISRLEKAIKSLEANTQNLTNTTNLLQSTLGHMKSTVQTFSSDLERFTVTQMRMENSMQSTGQSVTQMNRHLKELNKETTLSQIQSQKLFDTFERGYVGIRKLDVIKDSIKNINKYTVSAEETERVLGSLITAQEKFVGIQERINKGGGMTLTERMTLDPSVVRDLDNLTRSQNNLMSDNSKQKDFLRSTQEMQKQWNDAWLSIQKSTMPVVTVIANAASGLTSILRPLIDMLGKITSTQAGTGIVTALAAVTGYKALSGSIGGMIGRAAGLGGSGSSVGSEGPSSVGGNLMVAGNLIIGGSMSNPLGPPQSTTVPSGRDSWGTRIKNGLGRAIRSPGTYAGLGAVGAIGGGVLDSGSRNDEGHIKRGSEWSAYSGSGLSMAGTGAMIGSMFGVLGSVVGAVAGGFWGLYNVNKELENQKKEESQQIRVKAKEREVEERTKGIDAKIGQITSIGGTDAISNLTAQMMDKNEANYDVIKIKYENATTDQEKQALAPQYEEAVKSIGKKWDSENSKEMDGDAASRGAAQAAARAQAESMYVQSIQAAVQEMSTVNELLQSGITGLQTMADLERDFYMDAGRASEAISGQNALISQQIDANDVVVEKQKQMVQAAEEKLTLAQAELKEGMNATEKAAVLDKIKAATLDKSAQEARLQGVIADTESKRVQRLKNIQDMMMQNYKIQQTQVSAESDWYEARNRLISEMRMGMGGTYQSMVDQLNVAQKQIRITASGVEEQKKVAAEYATEARVGKTKADREAAAKASKQASLQVTKMETELMQKQSDYLEKFNQLREGYIDRLAEDSFGGADVEFDPTKASGVVNFMGTGKDRGHYMVGGIGNDSGREEITSSMSRSGNRQFGEADRRVNYAQSDEMARYTGQDQIRGTPTVNQTIAMGGKPAPNITDVPGSAGANTTYDGSRLTANGGPTGMTLTNKVSINAAGYMAGGPAIAPTIAPNGTGVASVSKTVASGGGPSAKSGEGMKIDAASVNGNFVVNGSLIVNGRQIGSSGTAKSAATETSESQSKPINGSSVANSSSSVATSAVATISSAGSSPQQNVAGIGLESASQKGVTVASGQLSADEISNPGRSRSLIEDALDRNMKYNNTINDEYQKLMATANNPMVSPRDRQMASDNAATYKGVLDHSMAAAKPYTEKQYALYREESKQDDAKRLAQDSVNDVWGLGKNVYHDGRIPHGGGYKNAREHFSKRGIGPGEEMALIRKDEAILPVEYQSVLNPTSAQGVGGYAPVSAGGLGSTNVNVRTVCTSCMSTIAKESINGATGNDVNTFESGVSK